MVNCLPQSIPACPLAVFLAYPVASAVAVWVWGTHPVMGIPTSRRFGESARTLLVAFLVILGPPGTHL